MKHIQVTADVLKRSNNFIQEGFSFIPTSNDDNWVALPLNPDWSFDDLKKGSKIIVNGEFNYGLKLEFRNYNYIINPTSRSPERKENTLYSVPLRDNIILDKDLIDVTYLVISGRNNAFEKYIIESIDIIDTEFISTDKRIHIQGYPVNTSLWRKGELDVWKLFNFNPSDGYKDNDIVLFKQKGESIDDTVIRQAISNAERLPKNIRIINHPEWFVLANYKDQTFNQWSLNNVKHPEYEIYENLDQLEKFRAKHGNILFRLNNQCNGSGTVGIDTSDTISSIEPKIKKILETRDHLLKTQKHTEIFLVKRIIPDSHDKLIHGRSYILRDEIICSNAMLTGMAKNGFGLKPLEDFSDLLAGQVMVERFASENKEELLRTLSSVHIDLGTVDYILKGKDHWFLEVNAYWGMGYGKHWPYNPKLIQKLEYDIELFQEVIPQAYIRMNEFSFWKKIYEKL